MCLVGVIVRRYIDFLILLIYPYSCISTHFCSSIPTFLFIFKMFFVLIIIICVRRKALICTVCGCYCFEWTMFGLTTICAILGLCK